MNRHQDTDRLLAGWLEDGPSRAPERPMAAALEHARSHPRHRDPFASIRRDPMATGPFGASSGLRALPLAAALGALLVAALAVASVGGLFDRRPVVVPPDSATPTATLAPSPVATATPAPTATPVPSPITTSVDLAGSDGRRLSTIEVVDQSRTLVSARSGQPGDGGSASRPDRADVRNDPADPKTVLLTWTGLADDEDRRITISGDGRTMVIDRLPGCGDLLPFDRVLVLTFADAVPAADVTATIVDATRTCQ